jgi:hypothetical protein
VFPHPSETIPHVFIGQTRIGVHVPGPHVFAPAPPQCCPAGHCPQLMLLAHPSETVPQLAMAWVQLLITH